MLIRQTRAESRTMNESEKRKYYIMEPKAMDTMLNQMRLMTLAAQGNNDISASATEQGNFADVLKNSLDKVNAEQKAAHGLAQSFEAGETTNIEEVMISLQKASLSFQEMVQVRNKLVAAYNEIMSMTV